MAADLVWALTIFVLQPSLVPVDGIEPRSRYELHFYQSRSECQIVAQAIRIDVKAARLRCVPVELGPDEVGPALAGRGGRNGSPASHEAPR